MSLDKPPYLLTAVLSKLLALDKLFEHPKMLQLLFPPSSGPTPPKASPVDNQSTVPLFPSSAPALKDQIEQAQLLEHFLPSPHYRSETPVKHSEEPSASPAPISSTRTPLEAMLLGLYTEKIQHQMQHLMLFGFGEQEPSLYSAHLHQGQSLEARLNLPAQLAKCSPAKDWHAYLLQALGYDPFQQYSPSYRQSPGGHNLLWIDHEEEYLDEFLPLPSSLRGDQPAHLHEGHQSQIASPHLADRNLFQKGDMPMPELCHSYPPSPVDPLAHQRLQGLLMI